MSVSRRAFLARAGAFSAGFAGLGRVLRAGTIPELMRAQRGAAADGYGPLVPDPAGVFDLPSGFKYTVFSRTGEEMSDGLLVPSMHDGMAAFPGPEGKTILVRNHEIEPGYPDQTGAFGRSGERLAKVPRERFYDYGGGKAPCLGGTTTVLFDTKTGKVERQFLSLVGTTRNCAGGPTPWGTWLSCEEYTARPPGTEKQHGFVFEVPASVEKMEPAEPVPLTAMGRFYHEAVAVDPASGCVYLTEDLGDGLLYRFVPKEPGKLRAGGRLQAMMVKGRRGLDTRNWDGARVAVGERLAVEWVELDDVLSPRDDLRYRGFVKGAARFARGEGMWQAKDAVYWCCTNGGPRLKGQIWRYSPGRGEGVDGESPGTLELFIESQSGTALENADNLTVAPWGDLIVCEDEVEPTGDGRDYLVGVTPAGGLYKLGRNAMNSAELAGATFSPDGSTLFVNMQTPGLTLAVTGPWRG